MPPRTLLNRAMFNLMLVIDRYQKLKISFMLQNNQAEADLVTEMSQVELLDIEYVWQLASSFLEC